MICIICVDLYLCSIEELIEDKDVVDFTRKFFKKLNMVITMPNVTGEDKSHSGITFAVAGTMLNVRVFATYLLIFLYN